MNILLLLIVVILLVNTFLLCKNMKDIKNIKNMKMKEGYFEVDRLSTRYGPTDGPAFCTGMGVRNIRDKNKNPIGDDSFLFGN